MHAVNHFSYEKFAYVKKKQYLCGQNNEWYAFCSYFLGLE